MDQEKLKPCPFCGGKPKLIVQKDAGMIVCTNCKVDKYFTVVLDGVEKAIALWNMRSRDIPTRPIEEKWNPNLCPQCGADIGGECNDGYYENPHYTRCSECGQKLKWEDTSY